MAKFNLKILLFLSLGHLITDIYQSALPAVLPFLKEKLSLSYTMAGVIIMAANFTSSLIQPLFGHFSDRKKKPILLPLGCLLAGIGFSLLALQSSYAVVLGLVVISGLGIASYHPEGYKTASFFTGEKKVTGMAVFSVGGNLGFAIGPLLALYLIDWFGFERLPVIIMPSLLFSVFIIIFRKSIFILQQEPRAQGNIISSRINKKIYVSLAVLIAIVMMRSWIQMGLATYIPFYYINYLHGNAVYAGKLISIFLLGGAIGTLAGAPLADRWGHRFYLTVSMGLAALILPIMFFAKGLFLFVILFLLGLVLVSTFSVTIVMAQQLLPKNLGIASGLMVGFAIGAGGICVTLLGLIADHFGVPAALQSIAVLPLAGLLLCFILKYPVEDAGKA